MIFSEEVKQQVAEMAPGEIRTATLHGKSHRAYRSHIPYGAARTWIKDGVLYVQRMSDMTDAEYTDAVRTRAESARDETAPLPPHIRGTDIIREVARELGMQILYNPETGFFDAQLPPDNVKQRERGTGLKYFDVDNGDL